MQKYFIFKGVDSRTMDIIVTKMPPITKAKKRVAEIEIPGRHGVLYEDEETYENYTKPIECAIKNRGRKIDYSSLNSWLDGSGKLILSNEPNKVYRATEKNPFDISGIVTSFSKFLIQFDVQPFQYSAMSESDKLVIKSNDYQFFGQGNRRSDPVITVYGRGDITLIINDVIYNLVSVDGYVTIHAEMMEVYKENENKGGTYFSDVFPFLLPEGLRNRVSYIGNVEKIEIKPEWRWL